MDCRDVRDRELLEGYLAGTLHEREQEELEAHLFECDDCFREAEMLRGLQGKLGELPSNAPRIAKRAGTTSRWWWWGLGAAAVVTLSVAALIWWAASTAPHRVAELSPELAALSQIEAPYYEPIRLRGATNEAQLKFRIAMEHYTAADYASAIPGLEEAAALDPEAANISFFLGACYLLAGRTSDGLVMLDHTISLGDTPFLEESLLLAAKAHINTGDLNAALTELQAVIDLDGSFAAEANELCKTLSKEVPPAD